MSKTLRITRRDAKAGLAEGGRSSLWFVAIRTDGGLRRAILIEAEFEELAYDAVATRFLDQGDTIVGVAQIPVPLHLDFGRSRFTMKDDAIYRKNWYYVWVEDATGHSRGLVISAETMDLAYDGVSSHLLREGERILSLVSS